MSKADDALEIANLKATYCRAVDHSCDDKDKARAMLADLFADPFHGDYGFAQFDSKDEMGEFMLEAIGRGSIWMLHSLGSPKIVVDGDSATAEWIITVHSKRKETEDMMMVHGRYSDTFRRTADGWRIASIAFDHHK